MSLKFYEEERQRWPHLVAKCDFRYYDGTGKPVDIYRVNGLPAGTSRAWRQRRWEAYGRMGAEEAELGIRRLAARFGLSLRGVEVRFTSGHRRSRAGRNFIIINLDWANWLVVAHEVGHTYWYRRYSLARREGHNAHGKVLNRLIDRFCAWIVEQGWHQGSLAHELAVAQAARTALQAERERLVAMPEPVEARVARRRAQVRRLETKIKGLSTRLKRARRSLAALERSAARVAEAASPRG